MECAVWVGFALVVIGAVVGIFYWGGFFRGDPTWPALMRTREGMWFLAFICLTAAIVKLLRLRATLWPQLGIFDWFVLTVLLVAPILTLWRHFRHVRETTEEVSTTGFQLVSVATFRCGSASPWWRECWADERSQREAWKFGSSEEAMKKGN